MSHFGRMGPPDIVDTYSLLILNVSFRTREDDLLRLFDKYGDVVDVFIPKDRRTGESRGFAFVRYKYADEAQEAVDRLNGKMVDGRAIGIQFAKYGPNAERIQQGRIIEKVPDRSIRSRSRSPRRRYREDYHRDRVYRERSRDRYERDRYRARERDYNYRSRSPSASAGYDRERRYYDDESPAYGRGHGGGHYRRDREKSVERYASSPRRSSLSPHPSAPPRRASSPWSPDRRRAVD